MKNQEFIFNRVKGLEFLYDNFPYLFNKNRISLYFVNSKKELVSLKIEGDFDTLVLKRSGNGHSSFKSDISCKDNRFFDNLEELKEGAEEFDDVFDFCVECHKFGKNEDYYSDKLAIAQFSTLPFSDLNDKISFIPSRVSGVNTRDNKPYLILDFPCDHGNIFHVSMFDKETALKHGFDNYQIAYLAKNIHRIVDNLREFLLENEIFNNFQLILRIDSYLNLLPIDFRTPEAWAKLNKY